MTRRTTTEKWELYQTKTCQPHPLHCLLCSQTQQTESTTIWTITSRKKFITFSAQIIIPKLYLKFRRSPRPIHQPNLLITTAALIQILRRTVLVQTRRRHPQTGVLLEEIAGADHDRQWLG